MSKITYFCILFLLSFSLSCAENINVFEFTEKELLELKIRKVRGADNKTIYTCLLYTSPSPRDLSTSRMPSSA